MAYPGAGRGYPAGPQYSYPPPQAYPQAKPPPSVGHAESAELQASFVAADKHKTGHLTANELMNVPFSGQRLSLETCRKLVKLFDRSGQGNITINEFSPLHKFVLTTQAAFLQSDVMRSNKLDENGLANALALAGFVFQAGFVSALHHKFASYGTNGLTFEIFLQMCAFLGRLKATFDAMDAQRQGHITLTMEQLVNIAVHV